MVGIQCVSIEKWWEDGRIMSNLKDGIELSTCCLWWKWCRRNKIQGKQFNVESNLEILNKNIEGSYESIEDKRLNLWVWAISGDILKSMNKKHCDGIRGTNLRRVLYFYSFYRAKVYQYWIYERYLWFYAP